MATVDALVAALRTGDDAAKEKAAEELSILLRGIEEDEEEFLRAAILEKGGVELLLNLVRDGSEYAKEKAAEALGELASNDGAVAAAIVEKKGVELLFRLVRSDSPGNKSEGAGALAALSLHDAEAVASAVRGGIASLVELLHCDPWASGESSHAVLALRRLADRNDATRTEIEAAGGVAPLVALMRDSPYPGRANATWALASLARNKAIATKIVAEQVAESLVELVKERRDGTEPAAAALRTLIASSPTNEAAVKAANGIAVLEEWSAEEKTAKELWRKRLEKLERYRVKEGLDIFVVPEFAQNFLGIKDPKALLGELAHYPVVGKDESITHTEVQWVSGDNRSLMYRGKVLKRGKHGKSRENLEGRAAKRDDCHSADIGTVGGEKCGFCVKRGIPRCGVYPVSTALVPLPFSRGAAVLVPRGATVEGAHRDGGRATGRFKLL